MFFSYQCLIIHFIHSFTTVKKKKKKTIIIIITKKKTADTSKGIIASNKLGCKICT